MDRMNDLPSPSAEEIAAQDARYGPRTSYQHPDHDTETWPPSWP
jgi:hypothetical protein